MMKTVIQVLKEMNEISDANKVFNDFLEKVKKQLKLPANWKAAPSFQHGDGMTWLREFDPKKYYINLDSYKNLPPKACLEVIVSHNEFTFFDPEPWRALTRVVTSNGSSISKLGKDRFLIDLENDSVIKDTLKILEKIMRLPLDVLDED